MIIMARCGLFCRILPYSFQKSSVSVTLYSVIIAIKLTQKTSLASMKVMVIAYSITITFKKLFLEM